MALPFSLRFSQLRKEWCVAEALNCHLSDFLCGLGPGKGKALRSTKGAGPGCWGVFPSRGLGGNCSVSQEACPLRWVCRGARIAD